MPPPVDVSKKGAARGVRVGGKKMFAVGGKKMFAVGGKKMFAVGGKKKLAVGGKKKQFVGMLCLIAVLVTSVGSYVLNFCSVSHNRSKSVFLKLVLKITLFVFDRLCVY